MPLLFISHSSKDKTEAEQLLQWLKAQGFDSLFLDSDVQHGIKAGSDWEKTLYREIHRSHAFIFLLSDNWIDSQWCNFEFMQARALGKTIFPLRIQAELETTLANDIQHLDLSEDREEALQRLHTQLIELSLNTGHHTVWDRSRSPYPGMMAFEAEDAPVFFGREDEIRLVRERLVQHRVQGSTGLLVLLAGSGTGKSSLIKAGLLPRLRHDKRHWLVIDAMRPEREPLRKLAQVLALASDQAGNSERLFAGLQSEQALEVFNEALHQLRTKHQQTESTLLLTIDQAEELFTIAKPEQTRQLLNLLAAAEAEHLPVLILLAMRSEYLEALQALLAQQDNGVTLSHDLLTLNALPLERVSQLVRGPAQVAGLLVDDGLLSAVTKDAATTDALPLLAFALRELYERFGENGDLTLSEYKQLGANQLNPLENVVQDKATQAIRPQQLNEAELKALRDAFVPHMVRVNDSGDYVRQAADWQALPAEAHPLLDKLTNARLLIKRDGQVEVSHEALLRHWGLLNGWLREEHDFLLGKQQLEMSLYDWQQLPEGEQDKGLLRGIALERAREWLFADKAGLNVKEKSFIRLSHQAEEQQRKMKEQQRKKLQILSRGFIGVLIVGTSVSVWQAYNATQQRERAELALFEADKIISYLNFGLRDQLKPFVPLSIISEIRTRMTTYYHNLGDNIQSEELLRQRAVTLQQDADARVAQGKLPEAEPLYREAGQFIQQRVNIDPENTEWQRDLFVNLEKIGDVLFGQGKLSEAKALYEKSRDIARTSIRINPTDTGWQRDLSVSLEKMGKTLLAQGKLNEAKTRYEESRDIAKTLTENDPSNAEWQRDLSVRLNKIGEILFVQGKLDKAKDRYEESRDIAKALTKNDPSNTEWQHDLSVSLEKIGDILSTQGDISGAKVLFEKSHDISQMLTKHDPDNVEWQHGLSASLEKIGNILSAQGQFDEAKVAFEKSQTIRQMLVNKDPSNTEWQRELSVSFNKIGDILSAQSELEEAKAAYEKSQAIRQTLVDKDPSNTKWQYDLSASLIWIANILLEQGELNAAKIKYEKSRAILQKLSDSDPTNAEWQRQLSYSLSKIGDILSAQGELDEAQVLFEKSHNIFQALAENDPSNILLQQGLVMSHIKIMRIAQKNNELDNARQHGEKALSILKQLDEQGLLHGPQKQLIGIIEGMLEQLN